MNDVSSIKKLLSTCTARRQYTVCAAFSATLQVPVAGCLNYQQKYELLQGEIRTALVSEK